MKKFKTMKKFFAATMIFAALTAFIGCGSGGDDPDPYVPPKPNSDGNLVAADFTAESWVENAWGDVEGTATFERAKDSLKVTVTKLPTTPETTGDVQFKHIIDVEDGKTYQVKFDITCDHADGKAKWAVMHDGSEDNNWGVWYGGEGDDWTFTKDETKTVDYKNLVIDSNATSNAYVGPKTLFQLTFRSVGTFTISNVEIKEYKEPEPEPPAPEEEFDTAYESSEGAWIIDTAKITEIKMPVEYSYVDSSAMNEQFSWTQDIWDGYLVKFNNYVNIDVMKKNAHFIVETSGKVSKGTNNANLHEDSSATEDKGPKVQLLIADSSADAGWWTPLANTSADIGEPDNNGNVSISFDVVVEKTAITKNASDLVLMFKIDQKYADYLAATDATTGTNASKGTTSFYSLENATVKVKFATEGSQYLTKPEGSQDPQDEGVVFDFTTVTSKANEIEGIDWCSADPETGNGPYSSDKGVTLTATETEGTVTSVQLCLAISESNLLNKYCVIEYKLDEGWKYKEATPKDGNEQNTDNAKCLIQLVSEKNNDGLATKISQTEFANTKEDWTVDGTGEWQTVVKQVTAANFYANDWESPSTGVSDLDKIIGINIKTLEGIGTINIKSIKFVNEAPTSN